MNYTTAQIPLNDIWMRPDNRPEESPEDKLPFKLMEVSRKCTLDCILSPRTKHTVQDGRWGGSRTHATYLRECLATVISAFY